MMGGRLRYSALRFCLCLFALAGCRASTEPPLQVTGLEGIGVTLPDSVYRAGLRAAGGRTPYSWTVVAELGPLPAGLALTTEGVIQGSTAAIGTWPFTVRVMDRTGDTAEREISLIVPPVLRPTDRCESFPPHAVPTFADQRLAAAVEATAGGTGNPYLECSDAQALTSLSAHVGLTDLTGIHNLDGLRTLFLARNAITSLAFLTELPELVYLDVQDNPLSDLTGLGTLAKLRSLVMRSADVREIDELANLTSLTTLMLDNNRIDDLEPLRNLTRLRELHLHVNEITNLEPLSGLDSLGLLWVRGNAVTDLSPIASMSIWSLDAGSNRITSLAPLVNLPSLRSVKVDSNRLIDLGTLEGLRLTQLDLNDNGMLGDVSALGGGTWFQPGAALWLRRTAVSCTNIAAIARPGLTIYSDCV
jgi:hypothetical protein